MKKLLLIPALLTTLAMAEQKKIEISPMIGYDIAEGNLGFKDDGYLVGGLEVQFNSPDSKISPEFSLLYSKADYAVAGDTKVIRGAFNGVYTFDETSAMIPFAKLGAGFESIGDENIDNQSGFFLDAGVGAKVPFTDNIALKLEALYMAKLAHRNGIADSNLIAMAGLTFAFGDSAPKAVPVVDGDDDRDGVLNSKDMCKATPAGTTVDAKGCKVDGDDDRDGVLNSKDMCKATPAGTTVDAKGCKVDGDDDRDGVLNSKDMCKATPAGTTVDAKGCKVDGDDDRDGVLNSKDMCKATPAGTTVDAKGCKVDGDDDRDGVLNSKDQCKNSPKNAVVDSSGCIAQVDLHIVFENASYKVNAQSKENITKFANFLKERSNFTAKIVGYTDDRGAASFNQSLSEKRAKVVSDLIVAEGVKASRVTHLGMGESSPVADNATKAGRAQNRRIEAKLTRN
ncbi:OmpA family protein [Sulfurimonas aquatica]|uniref:OmpA family protein n=1 Tax=Sulfurimonas aquatica TaxID=2672570 RepID=A0A975GDT9_9BACT|nr:OmpA family protein [Sulfurimonas aquatica]QSZ42937.1 OmpA family protein [Sulfurimonas aquatica]